MLNIYFYFFFVNTHGYPWILKNYAGTRITDTRRIWVRVGQIFIQWVGYEGVTTCTLPVPLTSLVTSPSRTRHNTHPHHITRPCLNY